MQVLDIFRRQGQTTVALSDKVVDNMTLHDARQVCARRISLNHASVNEQVAQIGHLHPVVAHDTGCRQTAKDVARRQWC